MKKYQVDNDISIHYSSSVLKSNVEDKRLEWIFNQYQIDNNNNDGILNAQLQFDYENLNRDLDNIQREDLEWLRKKYRVDNDTKLLKWYTKNYQKHIYNTNKEDQFIGYQTRLTISIVSVRFQTCVQTSRGFSQTTMIIQRNTCMEHIMGSNVSRSILSIIALVALTELIMICGSVLIVMGSIMSCSILSYQTNRIQPR